MLVAVVLNLGAAIAAVAALTTAMRLAWRIAGEDGRDDRGWAVRRLPRRPRHPQGGLGRAVPPRPHQPAYGSLAPRSAGRRGPVTEGGPAARGRRFDRRLARRA